MTSRLATSQITAAQADLRFRARPKVGSQWHTNPHPAEDIITGLLEQCGLVVEREDTFFPTAFAKQQTDAGSITVEYGFAPDLHIFPRPGICEQYWEITTGGRQHMSAKRAKMDNASAIYGIRGRVVGGASLARILAHPNDPSGVLELLIPSRASARRQHEARVAA